MSLEPRGPTGESLVGEQAQGHLPSQNTSSALPLVPTTAGPEQGLAESQRPGAGESVSPLLGLKFTGSGCLSFLTCAMGKQGTSLRVWGEYSELADKQYLAQTNRL